ncbi:MAG: VCBS repeat-containing protein [Bacteroidales bacterium]|nr:VCBS repeat-containing protein [Bacteroidales bacterium]
MKSFLTPLLLILASIQVIFAQDIFTEFHVIDSDLPYNNSFELIIKDVDNDGIIDILAYNSSKVNLYKGLGFGAFSEAITLITGGGSVTLFDTDNDMDLDLFRFKGSVLYEYLNDGEGNFSNPTVVYNSGPSSSLICGDVDNDGDIDLVKKEVNDDNVPWARLYLIKNQGNYEFGAENQIHLVTGYYDANVHARFSDLFGTGNLDLVFSDFSLGYNGMYESMLYVARINNGYYSVIHEEDCAQYGYIDPADLDGDGDKELLWINDSYGSILKSVNNGNGFGNKVWITDGNELYVSFDINNDDKCDLWLNEADMYGSPELKCKVNLNGNFSYTYDVMGISSDYTYRFSYGDLNDDGFDDIAYSRNFQIGWVSNHPSTNYFYEEELCSNDSIYFGGQWITEEGMYVDSLTSIGGTDSIVKLSITLLPAPDNFDIEGPSEVVPDSMETYSVPVNNEVYYDWIVEGGDITSNPNNHTITVLWGDIATGTVTATAISGNSCQTTSILTVTTSNAIQDRFYPSLKIWPVPVGDYLYIETDKALYFVMYDLNGCEILRTQKKSINVAGLKGGVYLIVALDSDDRTVYQRKIIKK